MQAVVLVGGEGTRLRPLTLTQPKPAVRLVDRPFIRFMVDWLERHGIDEVVMACGFRAELLKQALRGRREGGAQIHYVEEEEPLGTGGPIRLAFERGLLSERFMVLNGDVLTDLDLTQLIASHERNDARATLALYPVDDPTGYGLVRREGGPVEPGAAPATLDGPVVEFLEKPPQELISTDEISAGAYVLERDVLDLIPAGRAVSIEREVFPRLVGEGLYGQRLVGYWMDIGTPERYLQASWDILEGRVQTEVAARLDGAGLLIDEAAAVDAAAEVSPGSLIERECEIEAAARIGPRAVVGCASWVGAGASVFSSVVDDHCRIGPAATVEGAILAREVQVGEGAVVAAGAVVGEGARIAAGALVDGDARVPPGEEYTA